MKLQKITPCLWFDNQAKDAAEYYTSIFKNSEIGRISYYGEEGKEIHEQEPGSVLTVEFSLEGQTFLALNGGPNFNFTEATSFTVYCENQEELDYFWTKLGENGPEEAKVCGWLKDKFGLSWQIVPSFMPEYITDKDSAKTERVMRALMKMKKLNLQTLTNAYNGNEISDSEVKNLQVEITVEAPIEKVWEFWNNPNHIVNWYFASEDWEAPKAENDLVPGGKFRIKMAAKDKSAEFDFEGTYSEIQKYTSIKYEIADGRNVKVFFKTQKDTVQITEIFEAEKTHSLEQQKEGWENILKNFKKYVENHEG